jgi:PhnB protein
MNVVMAITTLNPYLNFDGNSTKAIELYQSALGAKVEHLQRFGDLPDSKPEHKDRVMHAHLTLGSQGVIMISDTMPGMRFSAGTNMHVTLHFDDVKDMDQKFAALSAGGTVTMPLNDTFWGARFGMLIDAFGINWMFNCDLKRG